MNTRTDTSPKPTPPARLNEKSFRRFEKALYKSVTTFPNALIVQTTHPNAYACGFRNAMKSLYHFQWETVVPHALFIKLYEAKEIVVREAAGKVVIGSRWTTKATEEEGEAEKSGLIIKPHFPGESQEDVVVDFQIATGPWIVCYLASKQVLTQPVTLRGLTTEAATELSQSFDILLEPLPNGDWLLT